MYESCGGNYPEGSSHSNGFQLIREYFEQRSCRHCNKNYSADGIELIREEPGMVVVRVSCSSCGQPLGIALVGMSNYSNRQATGNGPSAKNSSKNSTGLPSIEDDIPYPADWSRSDIQRLAKKSKISYDDVLDAHEFFANLGDDWQKHLPKPAAKRSKRSAKPISA